MKLTTLVPLLTLLLSTHAATKKPPKDSILLSSVKSLTLRENAKTSHRRVPAVPQLTCTGPGCKHYKVDIMRCVNQGSAYNEEDVEWSCTANLPREFKLGSTDVICEGYENSNDARVLKGSCAVEYRLLLTEEGEEKYGGGGWFSGSRGKETRKEASVSENTEWSAYLFGVSFLAVLLWIVYSMWAAYMAGPTARRPPTRWGAGNWRGGGDDNDPYDPPPPYPGKRYNSGNARAEGWRPGFWSGAATGAAAGYAAGSLGGRRQEPREAPRTSNWNVGGNSASGWGSATRSSPSSSNSGSGARHESTGFGSTSRR